MPRSPTVYTLPPGTTPQVPNSIILSSVWNAALDDLANTLNQPTPIVYGGTGGTSVITGWDGLAAGGTDIATAGTINLTTATGPILALTGTTTVTGVTLSTNAIRFVRAAAAFQLTASANLIVNKSTSVNYTTTADDLLIFIGGAAGVVRVYAIGGAVVAASNAEVLAGLVTNKYVSPATAYFPTGFVYGLTLTTNATDSTNDIDIAIGAARSDDDTANIVSSTARGKQADVAWAVGGTPGSPAGGLDTGAIGNNRYAIWEIKRPDTGVVDTLFSLSFTSPTMPANYTVKALIGEFTRVGGANSIPTWYGASRASTGRYGINLNGVSVASTSGTSIDFTGIPNWAKRITVMYSGVSTSGTSDWLIQLGDSGGIETSGYLSEAARIGSIDASSTAGFVVNTGIQSADAHVGSITIMLFDYATNRWNSDGLILRLTNTPTVASAGYKSTSASVDRVRLTMANGTDTFDAGVVNISWE